MHGHHRPPAPGMFPSPVQPGARITFPDPLPVSGRGQSVPAGAPSGNVGEQYGIQRSHVWKPGETGAQQLLDTVRSIALWRISVFGNVLVTIFYGTSKGHAISDLLAPVVITVPGQAIVTARPRDANGTRALVTLTEATAGAISNARKFVDDSGGAVALDEGACRFFALEASSLTIAGVVCAVPAFQLMPLVAGSVLTTGSGFQEFEA